jgi:hypothetical protein
MNDRIPVLWFPDYTPNKGCLNCKHLDRSTMTQCRAFPNGIPLPIQSGQLPHDIPRPNDRGIQWEAAEDAPLGVRAEELKALGLG